MIGPRVRWAVGTGLVFLAISGLAALGSFRVVRAALERQAVSRLALRQGRVETLLVRWGEGVADALSGLAEDLERHDGAFVHGAGPDVRGEARRLMGLLPLESLTVLGADGRVVSSGSWPEQAGLPDPLLAQLPEGRAVVSSIDSPAGRCPAVLVKHPIGDPAHRLWLVGGRELNQGFVEELGGGQPAMLFVIDDGTLTLQGSMGGIAPEAVLPLIRGARSPDGTGRIDDAGGVWRVAWHELRDPADRLASRALVVVVGEERAGEERLLRRLGILLLGLVSAVSMAGVLTGVFMAGRLRRPLARLVRAVEAVSAGQADYAFTAGERDDLAGLAQAFSRLQRSMERQRERAVVAERLAAWRDIARHVAHEVKNPLAPIRLTVENLVRARSRDPQVFEELFDPGCRTILEEVEQLRRLVGEFSEFARLPPPSRRPEELRELLSSVLDLYRAEPGLEIVRRFPEEPIRVALDPAQMRRALHNVVGNAVEATARQNHEGRRLEVRAEVRGSAAVIEISDNGPGLTPEVGARIFEPYFTTKGQGTGLGMAIAYRIVIEHGGAIDAENQPTGGACFRIRLPLEPGGDLEPCQPS